MKKVILLTVAILIAWTGTALADACIGYAREDDYQLGQNQINQLTRDGIIYGVAPYGTITLEQFDSQIRKYDVMSIQDAQVCIDDPLTDPDSLWGEIIIYGLDYQEAQGWYGEWRDGEGNLVRERKFGFSEANLPQQVKNTLDNNVHLEYQWTDICQYVYDKILDTVGDCP